MPEKCLNIGVTGHRYLTDESTIRNGVREALARIACNFPSTCVSAVSPIAEGADRLVVKEILATYTSGLIAVLPFPIEEYLLDFESAESKSEFQKLIVIAKDVIVIPQSEDRNENYNNVGRTIVDTSDVMIAIWDGKLSQGLGGTGDIVEYCRQLGKPMAIVSAMNYKPGTVWPTYNEFVQGVVRYENFPIS